VDGTTGAAAASAVQPFIVARLDFAVVAHFSNVGGDKYRRCNRDELKHGDPATSMLSNYASIDRLPRGVHSLIDRWSLVIAFGCFERQCLGRRTFTWSFHLGQLSW